jgi:hypothetical protein
MPTGSGTTLPNAWTCLVSVIDFASGGANGNSTASGKRLPLRVWHSGEQQNGDIYLIREKDVRRFILRAPFLKCGILCHNVSRTAVGNDWRAGSHHTLFR